MKLTVSVSDQGCVHVHMYTFTSLQLSPAITTTPEICRQPCRSTHQVNMTSAAVWVWAWLKVMACGVGPSSSL